MALKSGLTNTDVLNDSNPYVALLDRLPAAVYACDAEGYISYYNQAAVRLWGRRPEIGKDLWCGSWKIFNPDGSPMPLDECPMARTLKTMSPVLGAEIIVEQPGGQRYHVLPHPYPICDRNGVLTGAVNMLIDISERMDFRKLQERTRGLSEALTALRQSEERYHRMIAEVQDYVIILLSKEGIVENWNRGAEKIKGYNEAEIVGKHFRIFYSPQDQADLLPERLIAEANEHGKANHEGWRVRKDGTRFWASTSITALHGSNGEVIGFSKVTRDLTDKKIAEEKLMQASLKLAQKNKELEHINEELSSFAYISSHDLQEPLRKIQTFSDRILELEYNNLSEKGRDYFARMQSGASRMQQLIRDILTYSRTTTSEKKLETTDLNLLLTQSKAELEVIISEKKAKIESDPLPTLPVVTFQMQQLFNNLINNSLKFSKPDVPPHIVIRVEMIDPKTLPEPATAAAKAYCHLSFEDNGIGFEPEYERKIFEVFQRLHGRLEYGGTGIGLAICKKIAENHGGFITADGRPGLGATFHVYLPVVQ